jgi:serine protease Do
VIQEVTPEIADSLNLPDARGALVSNIVPDGPAEKAGIIRGDVVLSFNNIAIQHSIDLPKIAAECEPGTSGTLTVNRDGEQMTIQLTLGEFPEPDSFPSPTE